MGIADGVNARLTGYLGHSSIQMTFDRHLLPGKETEAADLLNAYLARARDPAIGDET